MSAADISVMRLQFAILVFFILTTPLAQAAGRGFSPGSAILAADVNALRSTVNTKRVACGLGPQVWTDDPLTPGVPIKKVHIDEMRLAVQVAYTSQSLPNPTFTDPYIVTTTPIKAVHFQEIQSSVTALSCGLPLAGTCGAADSGTFVDAATATAAGLCATGVAAPAALSGAGPWSWTCTVSTPTSCSASQGPPPMPCFTVMLPTSWQDDSGGPYTCWARGPGRIVVTAGSPAVISNDNGCTDGPAFLPPYYLPNACPGSCCGQMTVDCSGGLPVFTRICTP